MIGVKKKTFDLPLVYNNIPASHKANVRAQYISKQKGLCMFCNNPLSGRPTKRVINFKVNWKLFPMGFRYHPVHLQHDHYTGLTEGVVHMKCNAYMWQVLGR